MDFIIGLNQFPPADRLVEAGTKKGILQTQESSHYHLAEKSRLRGRRSLSNQENSSRLTRKDHRRVGKDRRVFDSWTKVASNVLFLL